MKKQYFIVLAIAGMSAIMNVKAQNTPIDDFLKKYPSREGVTHVSMSQEMLHGIYYSSYSQDFSPSGSPPEAYSSVSVSKVNNAPEIFTDFKTTLLSLKYESFLEVNKENNEILVYLLKKAAGKSKIKEIVILRQQKNQISAIYIRGNIDVGELDIHLRLIKVALDGMAATQINLFQPIGNQFAFSMPSFDDLKFPSFQGFDLKDFKFESETFKQRMEESIKIFNEISMSYKAHQP